jgi:hypothetical protein
LKDASLAYPNNYRLNKGISRRADWQRPAHKYISGSLGSTDSLNEQLLWNNSFYQGNRLNITDPRRYLENSLTPRRVAK